MTDKYCSVSPFLNLPPELRNRINSLLFGGNAIHVSQPYSHGNSWFLDDSMDPVYDSDVPDEASDDASDALDASEIVSDNASDDAADESVIAFKRSDMDANHRELLYGTVGGAHFTQGRIAEDSLMHLQHYRQFDLKDRQGTGAGLPVELLRTCRQIHQEAALIPYAENSFVFHHGLDASTRDVLERYLGPKQRQAICSATILGVEHGHLHGVDEFLPGLKWVRAQIDLYRFRRFRGNSNRDFDDEAPRIIEIMEKKCAKIQTTLENMKGLHLVGAAVLLEPNPIWIKVRDEDWVRLRLAGKLEKVLLEGKTDGEAGGEVDLEELDPDLADN